MNIMKVLAVLMLVGAAGCEIGMCRRIYSSQSYGEFYYWQELRPTTFHGICAEMSPRQLPDTRWHVEKPEGVNPKTHGSLVTAQLDFDSREQAEAWVESRCPSVSKMWTVAK